MATAAPVESAAPSTPAVAAPTGSGAGDPLEALRNETIAWGHQGNTPETPAPSEPNSETPPAQQTAEGSTPPTEAPAPAPSSAHEDWIKRYGDPEKAAKEAFALEQRASAMAKELKELKSAQPTSTPTVPEQTAAPAAPVATPTAPAPQAQPAQPPPQSLEEAGLKYALDNDAKCRDLIGQFNTNAAQLTKLTTEEIPALQAQIASNQAVIAHPDVDELVKDNARFALQRAEMTLAAREAKAAELDLRNRGLDLDFQSRVGSHVDALRRQEAERSREAELEQDAQTKAQEFVGHWPTVFETVFKEQGIDPEMRAEIHEAVKEKALARPGRIDLKDLKTFMDEAIKAEFNKVDKYHRIQARQHALKKTADTTPAAPTGLAATASPAPASTEDPIERLRLETRQAYRAKGAR